VKRGGAGGLNIGGSSILVIFVLLCLTTFAILAVVSANSSYNLAARVVIASDNYFNADSQAEIILSQISEALNDQNNFFDSLNELGVSFAITSYGYGVIMYGVPIDDVRHLYVELLISDFDFDIVSWRVDIGQLPEFGGGAAIWDGR